MIPDFDIENEAAVTNLFQYHILQEKIFFDEFSADPRSVKTLLFNGSYTKVTGGQRVTSLRHLDDEIVFTSGIDTRALVVDDMNDVPFLDGLIQPIDTILIPPLGLAGIAD